MKEPPAPKHTNLLAKESSPYLLQHAHNPVDWHPWGDAAFEQARREGKPVFLSIGYSTCHWCHVMERESFEDEGVARFLNEHFVSVKVDREERPDVDSVYMAAVVATTGQGGWPMTVFLNHDRKPFFCGTYFPPEDRHGRPGFATLLRRIHEVWTTRRGDVDASADEIARSLREAAAAGRSAGGEVDPEPLARAVDQFRASYDERHGGFGPSPKFPRAFALSFLLESSVRDPKGAAEIRRQVEATLDAMRRGGLHDHVGGGFHRYSTDREWLVPHFEKMLYDQATLVHAYVDAWLLTRNTEWERTARGAVEYVLRDLRDPAGGFLSAEDADSEGHEGKFYVWTEAELAAVLGDEDAAFVRRVWGTHPEGNFRDEATGVPTGANILHLRASFEHHAKTLGVEVAEVERRAASVRARLFAARAKRVRPHLDDKVLADWNGLMIGAAARAGAAFGDPRYVAEAARAADFVLREMRTGDGALLHRWRKGTAGIPGFLEDHAFLALGLLDLWEATFDPRWLRESRDLCRTIVREFRDADGTFAHASHRGETLIADPRDLHDGAIPSGNSAAALALLRVGAATGDEPLAEAGRRAVAAWMPTISRYPAAYPFALRALAWAALPTREVVIAGDPGDPATRALLGEVRKRFLPDTVVILRRPGEGGKALADVAPFAGAQDAVGGKPAAYVCRDRTCAAPVTAPDDLARLLDAR